MKNLMNDAPLFLLLAMDIFAVLILFKAEKLRREAESYLNEVKAWVAYYKKIRQEEEENERGF